MAKLECGGLKWVKKELDVTLNAASKALNDYVHHPDDDTPLRECFTYIHLIHGVLQMLELYGAALLSEEMEEICIALLGRSIQQREEAYDILMRAIIQMPDYLERIQNGAYDTPIVLLPILNDLRAIRGDKLLTESAMFSPDLDILVPPDKYHSDKDIQQLAKVSRHQYQIALLNWYNNKHIPQSLTKIAQTLNELKHASDNEVVQQLLWIAQGSIEALLDQGVNSNISLKLLFGQLDRLIKILIDQGEEYIASSPPRNLMKNLLFYVAQSHSTGKHVSELKRCYQLDKLLPSEDELYHARASLSGTNKDLAQAVNNVIENEFAVIKETLNLFVRNNKNELFMLSSVAKRLHDLSDTYGMLGEGKLRRTILQQAEILEQFVDNATLVKEHEVMDIANVLLWVSSITSNVEKFGTDEVSIPENGCWLQFSRIEQQHIYDTAFKEIITEIHTAQKIITDFIEHPDEEVHYILAPLPFTIKLIHGALVMLMLDSAAHILIQIETMINQELCNTSEKVPSTRVEILADTITALEYYMRSLLEQQPDTQTILEIAEQCIEKLYPTEKTQETPYTLDELLSKEANNNDLQELDKLLSEELAINSPPSISPVPIDPSPTISSSPIKADNSPIAHDSEESEKIDITDIAIKTSTSDDSLLTYLHAWLQEPDNNDLSADFINEVIFCYDQISLNAHHPRAMHVVQTLRDMTTAIEQNPQQLTRQRYQTLETLVEELTNILDKSMQVELTETVEKTQTFPGRHNADQQKSATLKIQVDHLPEGIDEDIANIFLEEAQGEIEKINHYLELWQLDSSNLKALTELRRSYHTLKGSGRLVGAQRLGEFSWAIENMLNRIIDATVKPSPAIFPILEESIMLIDDLIYDYAGIQACHTNEAHYIEKITQIDARLAVEKTQTLVDEQDDTMPKEKSWFKRLVNAFKRRL